MMTIPLVVLNYNGRRLLAECLPSLLHAARQSRHDCPVIVIDNGSVDDSVDYLRVMFPQVQVFEQPNRGLCSYNAVLPRLSGRAAILLNNDVKLAEDAVDPLVEPLLTDQRGANRYFMSAPRCLLFDGVGHEGLQAAVRWRWGLVEATAYFPGYERAKLLPGLTAAAGPVMAVDRELFGELGGFDPLYLPGRLEDLDFAYRGYAAGYQARYVPESIAFHQGQASFNAAIGPAGCDALALRNTLLFQWKNLRRPRHIARHVAALPLRLVFDVFRAPLAQREVRWAFTRAFLAALGKLRECLQSPLKPRCSWRTEREFFERFDAERMAETSIAEASSLRGSDLPVKSESSSTADLQLVGGGAER
jgi:GT2 family glycosyltransferase